MTQQLGLRRSHVIVAEGKPAPISDHLRGRTVERLLSTKEQLLIRCTDGTEVRVSWRDLSGRMIGTPFLDDVRRWK
jgi:hypothetical protein